MPTPRKKPSALGAVADILASPAAPVRAPAKSKKALPSAVQSKQRDTGGDGKMQTIYLRANDLDRANELEYRVKKARTVPGRVGLSLMLRAGLKLLEDEFAKSEKRAIELVTLVASEGKAE